MLVSLFAPGIEYAVGDVYSQDDTTITARIKRPRSGKYDTRVFRKSSIIAMAPLKDGTTSFMIKSARALVDAWEGEVSVQENGEIHVTTDLGIVTLAAGSDVDIIGDDEGEVGAPGSKKAKKGGKKK